VASAAPRRAAVTQPRRHLAPLSQAHRFVSTLNGTAVALALLARESPGSAALSAAAAAAAAPGNCPAPSDSLYPLPCNSSAEVGAWLDGLVDAGSTHLECFPGTAPAARTARTSSPYSPACARAPACR